MCLLALLKKMKQKLIDLGHKYYTIHLKNDKKLWDFLSRIMLNKITIVYMQRNWEEKNVEIRYIETERFKRRNALKGK